MGFWSCRQRLNYYTKVPALWMPWRRNLRIQNATKCTNESEKALRGGLHAFFPGFLGWTLCDAAPEVAWDPGLREGRSSGVVGPPHLPCRARVEPGGGWILLILGGPWAAVVTRGSFWLCRVSWRLRHCWHRPVVGLAVCAWHSLLAPLFRMWALACAPSSPGERMPPFPVRAAAWISELGEMSVVAATLVQFFRIPPSWGAPPRGMRRNPWSALQRSGACCGGFEHEHCTPAQSAKK